MRAFLVAVGLSLYPALAAAMNYAILQRACIGGAIPVPPFETAPIPVGCEIVDCCPGCPGLGPLEWRIRLDGKVATRAELRFEGLPKEQIGKLKIEGAAKLTGERILLSSGSTRIGGIPHGAGTPVTVGMLQPQASAQAKSQLPPGGNLPDRIVVEQFMGPFLVNSFSWTWVPKPCIEKPKPPALTEDRLRINGIATGDEVSVMLFSRTNAGCMDGTSSDSAITFSSSGVTWLGNRLSPNASCSASDVSVFSKKHAMKWEPVPWTDSLGDTHTVTLESLIPAALNIWVPDAAFKADAEVEAQLAQDLFLENRVGVRLDWNVQVLPAALLSTVNNGAGNDAFAKCTVPNLAAIRNAMPSIHTANTLNVYYVHKIWPGRNCAIEDVPTNCELTLPSSIYARADANITFIGIEESDPTTLVHELGHAYGLRPIACAGGHSTDPANIMYPSGTSSTLPRSTLELGQVFRMNTHGDNWGGTMLIPNAGVLLSRTPRGCFPHRSDADCPRVTVPWP